LPHVIKRHMRSNYFARINFYNDRQKH
jgi:hypothetical protein